MPCCVDRLKDSVPAALSARLFSMSGIARLSSRIPVTPPPRKLVKQHRVRLNALKTGLSFQMRTLLHPSSRPWLARLVLLAIVWHALIPSGFMPAAGRLFTLQICPDGFPEQLLPSAPDSPAHAGHHDHGIDHAHGSGTAHGTDSASDSSHDHKSWRSSHCVFAAIATAPPMSDVAVLTVAHIVTKSPGFHSAPPVLEADRFRLPQSRAPPSLA